MKDNIAELEGLKHENLSLNEKFNKSFIKSFKIAPKFSGIGKSSLQNYKFLNTVALDKNKHFRVINDAEEFIKND